MSRENYTNCEEIIARAKIFLNVHTGKDLAIALGVSENAISTWKKRKTLDMGKILLACEGVRQEWLLTGKGEAFITNPDKLEDPSGDYVGIPLSNGEISAGGGLEPCNSFDFKLFFHKEWLARKGNADDMSMIRVSGNSMEPTVQHGDVALINHAVNHIDTPGAIYAIAVDGQVSLKRLQLVNKTGEIKIISDNKDYDVDYVDPENVNINGKALWVGRELR